MLYHIMGEYYALCIIRTMKMCIFEVVSHSIDIMDYLYSMWHVFSNKLQFAYMTCCSYFWILFVRYFFGREFLKCGLLHQSWKTIFFKIIRVIALHDCLT